jgi:putative transposase
LKIANVVAEYTREALAVEVDRSITADKLIDVIERLVVTNGAAEQLRMNNGPELLSWALRDWCRFTGTRTICIEPGSPGRTPSSNPSTAGPRTSS